MADEKTFTQADLDKIKADADARIEAMDAKVTQALDEAKEAKRKLRSASEISPEDFAAVEAERDKALAEKAELDKTVKTLTKERDDAAKKLESESGFTSKLLIETALNEALAEAGVKEPGLLKGAKALMAGMAQVATEGDQRVVKIGEKTLAEQVKAWAATDEAKHYISADNNTGGGAPGGTGGDGGKTMTKSEHQKLATSDPKAANQFVREGGKVVADAA